MEIKYYNKQDDQTPKQPKKSGSLAGKIIASSPHISDMFFEKALVYICTHEDEGAVGVIINNKITSIDGESFISFLNMQGLDHIKQTSNSKKFNVYLGGPVHSDRLLVLSMDDNKNNKQDPHPKIDMHIDTSKFLISYFEKKLKCRFTIYRGVSFWSMGQLDEEVLANDWIITDLSPKDIMFTNRIKPNNKWNHVIHDIFGARESNDIAKNIVYYSGNA